MYNSLEDGKIDYKFGEEKKEITNLAMERWIIWKSGRCGGV